jgi:YwiC-like protein
MSDPARRLQPHENVRAKKLLLPREHGAYTELGFSLATALGLGRITSPAILLAASLIAFFVAHEPIAILLRGRGNRRLAEAKHGAVATAALSIGAGIILGAAGWWQAPVAARSAVLLPLCFGAALMLIVSKRREKSALGEMLMALTFAGALIPIALAAETDAAAALMAAALWAVIFILQTLAVREVRGRGRDYQERRLSPAVLTSTGVFVIAALLIGHWLSVVALLPSGVIAAMCGLLRVSPRRLRTVGWAFAVSDVLAFSAMLALLR